MRATRIPIGSFVALLALTSCEGTTPHEPPPPAVLVLEAVTPVSATGIVGKELDVAPVVLVTRGFLLGRPVEGIQVTFVVSGGGLVGSATVMTDAAGRASPGAWRLGQGAGPQTLKARAAGRSVVFTADAQPGPITSLAVVDGSGQRATAGTPLPAPLRVKATDGYGNVVTDAAVTFAVVDGGGSLEPGASITGSDGIAESRWTLGTTAVRQHVRAQTGEASAQFTADACQPGPCSVELAHVFEGNIVILNTATGGRRQLTSDGLSYQPAWSPDGERIAFMRYSVGEDGLPRNSIYVINSDGTGVTQVTGHPSAMPTWSPQGDALAFYGGGGIYVQELSEGSVMRLVAASGFAPAWSPDGSRIAFVASNGSFDNDDLVHSLRLVNPDGSGLTEITPFTSAYTDYIGRPTWSPDATRIAFDMGGVIYVVRADGTGRTQLTHGSTPAWSPDGTRIAYYSVGESNGLIMEIPAEGGKPTLLTSGGWPSWRP
jgi:TolB protein